MKISFAKIIIIAGISWLLFLFISSLIRPPFLNSDPAHGVLDLLHFQKGGKFQHHFTANGLDVTHCIEERTTWWSPGQWYFIYLFVQSGMPLGVAISLVVLLSVIVVWFGWMKLYQHFGFESLVAVVSGLLILFSRYLYSSFQIFPGASIFEIAVAPWLILLWIRLNNMSLLFKVAVLLIIIPLSFFIKSSLLIIWLCLIGSIVLSTKWRQLPWLRLLFITLTFFIGKHICDILFTNGGATPFSFTSGLGGFSEGKKMVLIQHLLFLCQGPFLASLGLEDYIKYIFQKPGYEILSQGHPLLLIIYSILFLFFILFLFKLFNNKVKPNPEYLGMVLSFTIIFILFFLYSYITTRPISSYEDSRHFRIAGLLLLPFCVKYLIDVSGRYVIILPIVLFAYALFSHVSKLKRERVLLSNLRIPSPIINASDYRTFLKMASETDFVYVTTPEMKYELDPCKSAYQLDDFTSIQDIKTRKDQRLSNFKILFVLPEHFKINGKETAILSNFKATDGKPAPEYKEINIKGMRLISVKYH